MTPLALRGTGIGRLRVHASGEDPQALAYRCALALRSLDLEPAAMPPQAILCVRALQDPLPGAMDGVRRGARSGPLAWQAAMRTSLTTELAHAARPIHGPVPSDATAVLFADPAELLACAARDAGRGPLSSFWWWRHLIPAGSFEQVVRAWQSAPEYVPAAFDALAASGGAMPFVRRLSPAAASGLLDSVLRVHALPLLADAIRTVSIAPRPVDDAREDHRPSMLAPAPRRDPHTPTFAAAPWREVVPAEWRQEASGLERYALASLLLVLRRAPSLPRRGTFTRDVVSYLRSTVSTPLEAPPARPPAADPYAERTPPAPLRKTPTRLAAQPLTADVFSEPHAAAQLAAKQISTTPPSRRVGHRGPVAQPKHRRRCDAAGPSEVRTPATGRVPPGPAPITTPEGHEPAQATVTGRQTESASALGATGVQTALAGAFFFVNVAVDLDIDRPVWDFVRLMARHFSTRKHADDGLWQYLRELAGPRRARYPRRTNHALIAQVSAYLAAVLPVVRPGRLLLTRPGHVTRTPGHLDVHFALERHPIEIRIARLDRNPGWIPAAGVHVAFHFD